MLEARCLRSGAGRIDSFWVRALRGNSFCALLLASGGLLTILAIPWLIDASCWSLPSSSHDVLPLCVHLCTNFPFLQGHQSCWLRSHSTLTLNKLHLQRICFQIRLPPEVLGVRTSTCELGGDTIQPITPSLSLLWLWDHQTTFWLLGVFPGTQDWAVRVLENIATHPLVTGDDCPHCEWSFCSLKSLWWVWPAWIPSWEPGHCSCTDKVSFGDYTAVKSHLSKMMDVITKGMEIPESQAGIPRYSATDSPSIHWSIFPEQQAFWKVVNFWAHLRPEWIKLSTQENAHLPLLSSLTRQPSTFCIWEPPRRNRKVLIST